jgi:hypothetical protein
MCIPPNTRKGDAVKHFALFAFAFTWLAACDSPSAPTSQALAVKTDPDATSSAKIANDRIEISGTEFNSCPPAELVRFRGSMHFLVTGQVTATTTDIKTHINMQGVEGVGLTSGDRYRVLRNLKSDLRFTASPSHSSEETDVRFRLIRQGSKANLWLRQTIRTSFPPLRFELIRNEIECRG